MNVALIILGCILPAVFAAQCGNTGEGRFNPTIAVCAGQGAICHRSTFPLPHIQNSVNARSWIQLSSTISAARVAIGDFPDLFPTPIVQAALPTKSSPLLDADLIMAKACARNGADLPQDIHFLRQSADQTSATSTFETRCKVMDAEVVRRVMSEHIAVLANHHPDSDLALCQCSLPGTQSPNVRNS